MPINREGRPYFRTKQGRPETEREKRERIMPGSEDLEKISHGIMEDDVEELEEFNTSHDDDGEFSTKGDERCDSSYFVSGKRKRKTGSLTNVKLTGRGKSKDGQGKYRCKDNSKKFENQKSWGDLVQDETPCRELHVDELLQMIKEAVDEHCDG